MPSIKKRPDGRWRARYRDDAGKEHAKHFRRKHDAQTWLDQVTASVVTGTYVDPKAGRKTFKTYAEQWRKLQAHRDTTRAHVETHLRRHVYPALGDRRLSSIRTSHIQALVRQLEQKLAPSTVEVIHTYTSSILKAAVVDRLIASNPCTGVKLTRAQKKPVVPLETDAVRRLVKAAPKRYRALVTLSAGTAYARVSASA